MDEAPTIWLTGILEQAPTMVMGGDQPTVQLDLIANGPDGPVSVRVEAAGDAHTTLIAGQRPGKGDRIVIHGTINDDEDNPGHDVTADLIALHVSDGRARA